MASLGSLNVSLSIDFKKEFDAIMKQALENMQAELLEAASSLSLPPKFVVPAHYEYAFHSTPRKPRRRKPAPLPRRGIMLGGLK